jgi:hypothetical protein
MANIAARARREIQDMVAFSVRQGPTKKQIIPAAVNARLRGFARPPVRFRGRETVYFQAGGLTAKRKYPPFHPLQAKSNCPMWRARVVDFTPS